MNLWAESDNPELASTQQPGMHVGTRFIASSHASLNTLLPALRSWLLADYIAPYCRSLAASRIFRRCLWIDALGDLRASKRSGESKGYDGRHGEGREGGRDSSRPYIFEAFNGAEQSNHSPSRPDKATKKARSEALPDALQAAVALSAELARESKPITLQTIALNPTRPVGTRLIASAPRPPAPSATQPTSHNTFVLPKESSVINAGWREAAPALLPAIEQLATIFLLNPLAIQKGQGRPQGSPPRSTSAPAPTMNGVPFLTVDELTRIVQRTAPTELCMVLMHRHVESVFLPALHSAAGAAAFTALLRSDRWKAVLAKESENAAKIDTVVDLWRAVLQLHFSYVQRLAFPMLLGPATVEDAPCSLLFATRRQDSLLIMNDAVCGYRRRLEQESCRGLLNEAWFAAQQAERDAQALQQLSEDTLSEGRARTPRRWPDLRQQLLLARFGQWMLREYDEVICRLLQAEEVRCEWRQPISDALPFHVPGNEDILQWQWKKRRY